VEEGLDTILVGRRSATYKERHDNGTAIGFLVPDPFPRCLISIHISYLGCYLSAVIR
jgi:hypothetical protein